MGTERILAPSVAMILELVRALVSKQFPFCFRCCTLVLATAVTPFESISAVCG